MSAQFHLSAFETFFHIFDTVAIRSIETPLYNYSIYTVINEIQVC